jgi:hypothetical protein
MHSIKIHYITANKLQKNYLIETYDLRREYWTYYTFCFSPQISLGIFLAQINV